MKFLAVTLICLAAFNVVKCSVIYFDFNNDATLELWEEHSDIQFRNGAGASKADMTIVKNKDYRRAVFFGFASSVSYQDGSAVMRTRGSWDWSKYSKVQINCKGYGDISQFSLVLRSNGNNYKQANTVFLSRFTAPAADFETVEVPFSAFAPKDSNGAEPLDFSYISSIGIVLAAPNGKTSTASLEINWIGVV